ncbi:hypothetical protein B296_00027773 [Ensete ventricosum]|uniref:Uncharacterized protein n=1 Tax=Ensete ventricosum TaxID=4639 RepID=A0A427AMG7_ENSVE|nr:hypothetical protein B296_00027773 [Ensete ventricosum]
MYISAHVFRRRPPAPPPRLMPRISNERVGGRLESVRGFVSHCGWNSVLKSVSVGVPIPAWPFMAQQHLNAKFVVEEFKVRMRVRASDGLVKGEDLEKLVGKERRERGREERQRAVGGGEGADGGGQIVVVLA